MKYRFIAADIDGTLLTSKGELTERTEKAVREAVSRGVYFSLSTGRPLQGIGKLVSALGLEKMPHILYNGAMAVMGEETLYSLTIDPATAREVVDEGHRRGATMICWSDGKLYAESICDKVTFYKSIIGVEPIVVSSLSSVAERGITKFVWYGDALSTAKDFAELSVAFDKRLNVHPSRVDFLEFVNKDCSKAAAIEKIIGSLGISREETVAIGDGFNDLKMLAFAGLGVAMGNADERVKEVCKVVTATCDEDGLAKFIENYVLR